MDDAIKSYLLNFPYPDKITIRQLISHTSGIPNSIPLKWVHLVEAHENFDEYAALARVLRNHSKISFKPGAKFAYSNIGYWLLGMIIETVTRQAYSAYVSDCILTPLNIQHHEMGFVIPDLTNHAKGYLAKYSMMNLLKGFITDANIWGGYEGKWLQVKNVYVNGPAFGDLIGSAKSFACFLRDQLRESSILLNSDYRELFYTEQKNNLGNAIGMTLGWHIGNLRGVKYFFNEGGGGGLFIVGFPIIKFRPFALEIVLTESQKKQSSTI